jgi:hypothetical protein
MLTPDLLLPGDVLLLSVPPKPGFLPRIISWSTGSPYYHAALVLDGGDCAEGWFPRNTLSRLDERLHAWRASKTPVLVLRPATDNGLTPQQQRALRTEALTHVGQRYAWWQVVWFFLTGWFWRDGRNNVICSRLVPKALEAAGVLAWNPHNLDYLARHDPRLYDRLKDGWATPDDLYEHGNSYIVYENLHA